MADETLGVVYVGGRAVGKDFGNRFAFLNVTLRCGGVGVDYVDVAWLQPGFKQAERIHSACRIGLGRT